MKTPSPLLSRPAAFLLLAAGLLLLAPLSARAQGGSLPAHPKTLLDTLPPAPGGWKLTKSGGGIDNAAWIITEVERHYEKTALVEGENPEKPPRTEFKILDSGGYRSYLSRFANFQPDPKDAEPGPVKRVVLGSYPAFVENRGSEGIIITLLARTRYLLTVSLYGQPAASVKTWLEAMNFRDLAAIPHNPVDRAPDELTILSIDELDPSKNSKYTTLISSADFAHRFALIADGEAAEAGVKSDAIERLRQVRAEDDAAARAEDAAMEAERIAEEAAMAAEEARGGRAE